MDPRSVVSEHHSTFLKLISEAAECKPEDIIDMDLYLYDANPAVRGLARKKFKLNFERGFVEKCIYSIS